MSELNEKSTFTSNIENNSTICSNCYRKLKSYSSPHYTMPDSSTPLVEYENHVSHYWVDDRHKTGRPSVKRSFCKCGDMDHSKLRPLDNRQIMEIAERIDSHLDDMEIEIDQDVFYSFIRTNREGSDIQFNEEKYFEKAIENALVEDE